MQLPTVIVTLYVPPAFVVAEAIAGFCEASVKPFGPVHKYVAPITVSVERFKALPEQIGELPEAAGVAGVESIVAVIVPASELQPVTVTTRL